MTRRLAIAALAIGLVGSTLSAQPEPVSYDTFMLLSWTDRLAKFQELTPENRAAIMREQVVRWRRVNEPRLTVEQLTFLAELTTKIRPELYDPMHPQRAQLRAEMKQAEATMAKLFTRVEAAEAFTVHAVYLPPQ